MPLGTICRVCSEITVAPVGGCCPEHAAAHLARDQQRRRAKPQNRIWNSHRWKTRTVPTVLRRDGYRCVDCGRHRDELAPNERLIADHVNDGGALATMEPDTRGQLQPTALSFSPDICETRCSRCSGRRDGARAARGRR